MPSSDVNPDRGRSEDLGAAFDTKRDLVPDTDAAALAAAQTVATQGCDDARDTAAEYLAANLGQPVDSATLDVPGNVWSCEDGVVTVGITLAQDNVFASVMGADDEVEVFASSSAMFEIGAGGGLRPSQPACSTRRSRTGSPGGDTAAISPTGWWRHRLRWSPCPTRTTWTLV